MSRNELLPATSLLIIALGYLGANLSYRRRATHFLNEEISQYLILK
jgi:hypothetical protein